MRVVPYFKHGFIIGVVSVCASALLHTSVGAATITVNTTKMTSTEKGDAAPGECSFFDAIAAAKTDKAVAGCAAGDPIETTDDVIKLPAGTFEFGFDEQQKLGGIGGDIGASLQGATDGQTDLHFKNSRWNMGILLYSSSKVARPIARFAKNLTTRGVGFDVRLSGMDHRVDIAIDKLSLTGAHLNISGWDIPQDATTRVTVTNIKVDTGSLSVDTINTKIPVDIKNISMINTGHVPVAIASRQQHGRTNITNAVIKGYDTGILNNECQVEGHLGYSTYVDNVLLEDVGVGVRNVCGHVNIQNTTFRNVAGPAVLSGAFHRPNSLLVGQIMTTQTEILGSTFTGVKGDVLDKRVNCYSGIENNQEACKGSVPHAVVVTSPTAHINLPKDERSPKLVMEHNTFSGNTATSAVALAGDGAYNYGANVNTDIFQSLTVKNNAIDIKPFDGNMKAIEATVAGNVTLADYPESFGSAGFRRVGDFKLGPLGDNGGAAPVGYLGEFGNVPTLRPLAGSPLIDAAVAGTSLMRDQRGGERLAITARDIGAVEVTEAEFVADGGVLPDKPGNAAAPGTQRQGAVTSPSTRAPAVKHEESTRGVAALADTGANQYAPVAIALFAIVTGVVARRRLV